MSLNYREETQLEVLVWDGTPAELAQEYLDALHAKLEALDVPLVRFWAWSQPELFKFLGIRAGWAVWVLLGKPR